MLRVAGVFVVLLAVAAVCEAAVKQVRAPWLLPLRSKQEMQAVHDHAPKFSQAPKRHQNSSACVNCAGWTLQLCWSAAAGQVSQ